MNQNQHNIHETMKTNKDEKLPSSSAMPNQVHVIKTVLGAGMFIRDNTAITI
jgi:hypothetical protein